MSSFRRNFHCWPNFGFLLIFGLFFGLIFQTKRLLKGGTPYFKDIEKCLNVTKCDAVMSAEGLLSNPSLFTGKSEPAGNEAQNLIRLFRADPGGASISAIKSFLFRVWKGALGAAEQEMRDKLDNAGNLEEIEKWNRRRFYNARPFVHNYFFKRRASYHFKAWEFRNMRPFEFFQLLLLNCHSQLYQLNN